MPVKPPSHKPARPTTKKHQAQETARGKTAQRGYGAKWQAARAAYLAKHPLCVQCEKEGKVKLATDLDHKIPHRGNMALFWDFENNVQGLCASHHSRKTASGQ